MSENPYELADKTVETPIDGGPVVDLLKNLKLPLDFSLPYRLEKMFPKTEGFGAKGQVKSCLLYTSPSPRDRTRSRMPSSA